MKQDDFLLLKINSEANIIQGLVSAKEDEWKGV